MLINPEQFTRHGLVVVGCRETGRPPALSVPGVRYLMGKEFAVQLFPVLVNESAFYDAVVA